MNKLHLLRCAAACAAISVCVGLPLGASARETVDAGSLGFDPSAAPEANALALQKALDGGCRTVTVTKPGVYRLDRTIFLDDDTTLAFAPGVVLSKAVKYANVLANRGAFFGGRNRDIAIRGANIAANGFECVPPTESRACGLRGLVGFYDIERLELRDTVINGFGSSQYAIQIVDFDGLVIDGFELRGNKDGIHLNCGRNFVIRHGKLRTYDDGIAINAGEWPGGCTPRIGSIEDGLVEDVEDEPGGHCNFARVITGAWMEWRKGMRLQYRDIFTIGRDVYSVWPGTVSTNETVSLTPPRHKKGVWKSPEGINFYHLQSDGCRRADIRRVTFRNIRMNCARSVSCSWELGAWARLVHPDLPRTDYPVIDIRLENVVKTVPGPIVSGNADANIVFDRCRTAKGPLASMGWSKGFTERPVRTITIDGRKEVVSVGVGRQLFVDDHVIASTNGVVRHWGVPVKMERPLIRPTSETDGRIAGCAVATDGGLWWDPTIRKYRLWYETDWAGQLRYAESADGLKWEMPDLGVVKGTNRVFSDEVNPLGKSLDSWSVWPDYRAVNPYADWKMLVSAPGGSTGDTILSSADGRRWTRLGVAGYSGDRTTLHFDAAYDAWVFSLRDYHPPLGRARRFHSQRELVPEAIPYGPSTATEKRREAEIWSTFDTMDFGLRGSLYNFDAVPYESLMLGVMEVLHNTPNDNADSEAKGLPKQTSLRFAFSRDGRNYVPAPASALKPSGWGSGAWDTGYLSAMGGICTVDDDRLRFYYSALRGDAELRSEKIGKQPMHRRGMYYNGAIGCATLRRDGFCGLVADGAGEVVTPPLAFTGSHLFVNAECFFGEVVAEIVGADGRAFPGFSAADCKGLKFTDRTKAELVFAGGSLATLADRKPRIRFKLHCATLYSFWISPSARGESRGYVAAGGPAYPGLRDL